MSVGRRPYPRRRVIVWGRNFTVDDALPTGESIAVGKTAAAEDLAGMKMAKPGYEDIPCV